MGKAAANLALVFAGLVWESVGEVYLDIVVVLEVD